jgi:hypothetical protein
VQPLGLYRDLPRVLAAQFMRGHLPRLGAAAKSPLVVRTPGVPCVERR